MESCPFAKSGLVRAKDAGASFARLVLTTSHQNFTGCRRFRWAMPPNGQGWLLGVGAQRLRLAGRDGCENGRNKGVLRKPVSGTRRA